ncbi:ndufa2, NADH:ubiquinone oxidoreductase 10.5kD subunit, partial [Coemansia sp. RSA 2603]
MAARALSTTVSKGLRELRVHMSQGAGSQGLRDFIVKAYPGLKQANPGLPVLIREASGVESRIIARFGKYNA